MRGLESLNRRQRECVQILSHEPALEHEVLAMPPEPLAMAAALGISAIDGIVMTHPRWHGLTLQVFITNNPYVLSQHYEMPVGTSALEGDAERRVSEALTRQGKLWLTREHNATLLAPIPVSDLASLRIPSSADHGNSSHAISERRWLGDEQQMTVFFSGGGHFMVLTVANGALVDVAVSSSLGLPSTGTALTYWPRSDIERLANAYCGPQPDPLAAFTTLCAERQIGLTRGEGNLIHVSDSPRDPHRGGTGASATVDLATGEVSDQFHAHFVPRPDNE